MFLHDRGRLKMECRACNKRPSRPFKQAALCTSKQPANNGTRLGNKGPDKALSLPELQLWRRAVSTCDNVVVTAFPSLARPTLTEEVEPARTPASLLLNLISRPSCYYLHYFLNKPLMLVLPALWSLGAHEAWFPVLASLRVNKAASWATRLWTSIQTP